VKLDNSLVLASVANGYIILYIINELINDPRDLCMVELGN